MAKKYPIAEIFTSPQGEGLWAGTLTTFIRLAGCSVGKKLSEDERKMWGAREPLFGRANEAHGISSVLEVYTERCKTWDGREFLCDTDFRAKEVLTVEEIFSKVPQGVSHVCLSGGEPMMHDLSPLINVIGRRLSSRFGLGRDYGIHIETSGTIAFDPLEYPAQFRIWRTVSPKLGVLSSSLHFADEIKLLVDEGFDEEKVPQEVKDHLLVYIQPVNYEKEINRENLERCLELQKRFPRWRLSTQAHKIWGVR